MIEVSQPRHELLKLNSPCCVRVDFDAQRQHKKILLGTAILQYLVSQYSSTRFSRSTISVYYSNLKHLEAELKLHRIPILLQPQRSHLGLIFSFHAKTPLSRHVTTYSGVVQYCSTRLHFGTVLDRFVPKLHRFCKTPPLPVWVHWVCTLRGMICQTRSKIVVLYQCSQCKTPVLRSPGLLSKASNGSLSFDWRFYG